MGKGTLPPSPQAELCKTDTWARFALPTLRHCAVSMSGDRSPRRDRPKRLPRGRYVRFIEAAHADIPVVEIDGRVALPGMAASPCRQSPAVTKRCVEVEQAVLVRGPMIAQVGPAQHNRKSAVV